MKTKLSSFRHFRMVMYQNYSTIFLYTFLDSLYLIVFFLMGTCWGGKSMFKGSWVKETRLEGERTRGRTGIVWSARNKTVARDSPRSSDQTSAWFSFLRALNLVLSSRFLCSDKNLSIQVKSLLRNLLPRISKYPVTPD